MVEDTDNDTTSEYQLLSLEGTYTKLSNKLWTDKRRSGVATPEGTVSVAAWLHRKQGATSAIEPVDDHRSAFKVLTKKYWRPTLLNLNCDSRYLLS
ncbi:hypothetical protein AtubIFM54640_011670 [Aspergillus tubingensis]|nr:hypothetical protein AtubIFM54640_011670 [Aspergillus tubingensis]